MDAGWLKFLPRSVRVRVAGRHGLQAIIGNSGWLFLDKALRLVVGVLVGVWLARYLGPEQYGTLNYAIAFVSLFGPLVTLGLDGIVVRELVRSPGERGMILGSAFSVKLLGACLGFVLAMGVIQALRPGEGPIHWLVGIIAFGLIFQSFDVFDFWFQSRVRSKFTVYAKSASFIFFALIKVAFIIGGASLAGFAWLTMAEVVVSGIGLALIYAKVERSSASERLVFWNWRRMSALLSTSWPMFLSGLAVMVYFRIDQVMLAEIAGERQVGIYSAALRLSEVWYAIPTVLVTSAMPSLVEAHGQSEALYHARLQQLFTTLARVAYLVAIPITLAASFLVPWLYGQEYADAAPILTIHIWTALFVFMGVALGPWIINEGLTKFYLFQTGAGAVTNVVLNVFLIPRFGGVGAAVATLISQIVATYLAMSVLEKTRLIFRMETRAIFMRT